MSENTNTGKFLYGIFGNTCVIKAMGNLNYHIGNCFDAFISKIQADNIIENFLIDLTETDYIDSTNLGLLARIQIFSVDRLSKKPTIISTNNTINHILRDVGFDRLFTIIDSLALPENLQELPREEADEKTMENVLLSAHRYLMHTSRENEITFHEIVELLEKDHQSHKKLLN